jgi:immune inhibitor A
MGLRWFPFLAVAVLCPLAAAVPAPPWMISGTARSFDLDALAASHGQASLRGVDIANPRYGLGNPAFGPEGAFTGLDGRAEMKVLILLVDFTDNTAATPTIYFDSLGYASQTFSLSNYYSEVSYGNVDIVTVDMPSTTGWFRAPQTYDYYVGDNYGWGPYPGNSQGLVADLCDLADTAVDFSQYDNDGDGYVDGVNVIFAGTFDGTPQTIWPHAWSLPGAGALHDGVYVSNYSVQNEYNSSPGDASANVICHEFGHVLGLPDLYDYDYDALGVGDWCVMSFGVYNGGGWSPAHLCAYSRAALGVASPINITSNDIYSLPPVETSGVIYRLWTAGAAGSQYFLVENRRPIGYDAALPSHGTLIWHIDESVTTGNDNQWYPGYTSYGHYMVALEQADGQWHIEKNINYGDTSDPYPGSGGNDAYSAWTVPDSRDYTLNDTQVAAEPNTAGDVIQVYLQVFGTGLEEGPGSAGGLFLEPVGNPSAAGILQFGIGMPLEGPARLEIYDCSGRLVGAADYPAVPSGISVISWDGGSLPNGVYAARLEGAGETSTRSFMIVSGF